MNTISSVDQLAKANILVVDDEARIRKGCQAVLSTEGYSVQISESGSDALEMINANHYDIILLDLMMPGISGFDVLEKVRTLHPDTVVIVITGYATVEHSIEALKTGAFDFIPKPFPPDHLRVVVSKALEYNRALKDISNEKSRMRALVNHLGDGVLLTDNLKQVVFANPAFLRLAGCQESDITGKSVGEVVQEEALEDLIGRALDMQPDEFVELTEEWNRGATGEEEVIAVRCVPFRDRLHRNLGTISVWQDISRLKKLDQMKSDFVSTVSHEIRSPMNSVMAQLKVIMDGLAGEVTDKQQEILSRASQKIQALSQMATELLDLARIESGLINQEKEKLDVAELLQAQVDFFADRAAEKEIRLGLEPQGHLPSIMANRYHIEEVVSNLISNALRYTPPGGELTISTQTGDNYLSVLFRDTGIGIEPDELERVFDRFYRVKNSNTRNIIGTGLGLAIVKDIVEAHNGMIRVESEVGKGSTFRVFLPLLKE